jgi:hypothetical protein
LECDGVLETYLAILKLDFFEVTEAFKGLADENVWKRPAAELLSVGELAGHVAYWEAVRFAGEGLDPNLCKVKSPLIDERFAYYPTTLSSSPSPEHLNMTAKRVCSELLRVHEETAAYLCSLNPPMDSPFPGGNPGWQYGEALKYTTFHVAYHTGQIYSVRHLLGETPPDN